LETLRSKGYRVIPINPWKKEVAGLKSYPSISDTQEPIDVVDLVTPPEVTEKVVRECKQKGITRVWMQPGAQSDAAVAFCKENGIACVYNLCVMLEAI
jgi:predicted CoA-binding protein